MDLDKLADHCLHCKDCQKFREKVSKEVLDHIAKTENHPLGKCLECKNISSKAYFYITAHIKWENFKKSFLWGLGRWNK